MVIRDLLCSAIPDDAQLVNFEIIKPVNVEFFWSHEQTKNNVKFLSELIFMLYKYKSKITILPHFISDGGSLRRINWTFTSDPYSTRCLIGFLLHDALYSTEYFTRDECDWILLELLQELGVGWFIRNKIWMGVRAGGWLEAWSKHTEKTIADARTLVLKEDIENA